MSGVGPINPLLAASISGMINRVAEARMAVDESIRPASTDLAALSEFLAFEIQKSELDLERAEWNSVADTKPAQLRLSSLKAFAETVHSGRIDAIRVYLDDVLAVMRNLRDETA